MTPDLSPWPVGPLLQGWAHERVRELEAENAKLRVEVESQQWATLQVIDERDAVADAVQRLDLATGGDGEIGWSSDGRLPATPAEMCERIAERFAAAAALRPTTTDTER